ncbi:MAG: hypothetical protein JWQ64_3658 [Subtercola sp.]|jgi:hypothetical protein|nr:hypothetical protein [Subtercola sp.]
MKSIAVSYDADSRVFEFHNHRGRTVDIAAAPGRPTAVAPPPVGSVLGSGTLIGYLSRAAHERGLRLVILTVLTDSGEQVAGPVLSDQLDDEEAGLIMRAAARTDDPISTLRRFLTFRPDRGAALAR